MNTLITKNNIFFKLKSKLFPFYKAKEIRDIFDILEKNQEAKSDVAMFVGGCVRKYIRNEAIDDIDIATIFSPEELKTKFKDTNIKLIETGLEHGSVTLINGKYKVEITTLRKDIKTDGRHAEIEFSNDWKEDSNRRDFTINAIYLSKKGKLFDPQLGVKDLENNIVKFIGDPVLRIKEDYLRIIRFIRFSLQYNSQIENSSLNAISLNINGIKNLSKERILSELIKIVNLSNFKNITDNKSLKNIFLLIFPEFKYFERLSQIKVLEKYFELKTEIILGMLIIDNKNNNEYFCHKYNVSNDLKKKLFNFTEGVKNIQQDKNFLKNDIKKNMYYYGKDLLKKIYLIFLSDKKKINIEEMVKTLQVIESTKIPKFPYDGKFLISKGFTEGKKIGLALKNLEEVWINQNFNLTKEDTANIIKKLK